ncbi:MAG: c-type cytochrome, partial [Pedobacter sp.]
IALSGNKTFWFPGKPVNYQVAVTDKGAVVNKSRIYVSSSYTEGLDMAGAQLGHQQAAQTLVGQSLMLKSDCSACHKVDTKSIGPAFKQVSAKYQKRADAVDYIAGKVIKGSSGVWGEVPMPAHSTMKTSEAKQIAEWIMSLGAGANTTPSLPTAGKITTPSETKPTMPVLNLKATYTDMGGVGLKPLSDTYVINLRSNVIDAKDLKEISGFGRKDNKGDISLTFPEKNGWVKLKGIDLTGITAIGTSIQKNGTADYGFEIRLDSEKGPLVGKSDNITGQINVSPTADGKLHDIYILTKPNQEVGKDKPILKTLIFMSN